MTKERKNIFAVGSLLVGVVMAVLAYVGIQTTATAASNCGSGISYDPATATLSLTCAESTDVHELDCRHPSRPEHLSLTVNGVNTTHDCPMNPVPSVTLTANGKIDDLALVEDDDLELVWSGSRVVSCTAPWTSSTDTSGTMDVLNMPLGNYSYSISCTDSAGATVTDSVNVGVLKPANLTISASLSPSEGYDLVDGTYDNVMLKYAFQNVGQTYAPESEARFEIDLQSDGVIDQTITENIAGITPGSTYGIYQLVVGTNVPLGEVTVRVIADVNDDVREGVAGENDNEKIVDLKLVYQDPGIELKANPDKFVRYNSSVELSWDTKASYFTGCTIIGPALSKYSFVPAVDGVIGKLPDVGPITSKSEFLLTCMTPDGQQFSDSVFVETTGTIQER